MAQKTQKQQVSLVIIAIICDKKSKAKETPKSYAKRKAPRTKDPSLFI